jgi:hypothetical protein
MNRLAPILLLVLAGCATGRFDCTDLRQGACQASFMRFGADTSASISGPDGFSLSYSSAPNAAATAEAFAAINRLAGLVGTVTAGRPPVPDNSGPPTYTPGQSEPDEMAGRSSGMRAPRPQAIVMSHNHSRENETPTLLPLPASCPAGSRPRRVTAATPWMVEGVARARDL